MKYLKTVPRKRNKSFKKVFFKDNFKKKSNEKNVTKTSNWQKEKKPSLLGLTKTLPIQLELQNDLKAKGRNIQFYNEERHKLVTLFFYEKYGLHLTM